MTYVLRCYCALALDHIDFDKNSFDNLDQEGFEISDFGLDKSLVLEIKEIFEYSQYYLNNLNIKHHIKIILS